MSKSPVHVMLDIETLGTKPGCKILQIGAVTMHADAREFKDYISIHILRSPQATLTEDPSTVAWWSKQDSELHTKLFTPADGVNLNVALVQFSDWIQGLGAQIKIWGNSASFDCKILEAAYDAIGIPLPWKYYNENCFRTLKNLVPGLEPARIGVQHNALDDAFHQAIWAQKIFSAMRFNWD